MNRENMEEEQFESPKARSLMHPMMEDVVFPCAYEENTPRNLFDDKDPDVMKLERFVLKECEIKDWYEKDDSRAYDLYTFMGKLVVPQECQKEVIRRLHEAGHGGEEATRNLLERQNLWFPSYRKEIRDAIKKCQGCKMGKIKSGRGLARILHLPRPNNVWEMVCIDHVTLTGDDVENHQSEHYSPKVLVMVDLCSRYTKAALVEDMRTETTIAQLEEWFWEFGFPRSLMSDSYPSFLSAEWDKWAVKRGIKLKYTPEYHPNSNGVAERAIQTIQEGLKASLNDRGRVGLEWNPGENHLRVTLSQVLYRINHAVKKKADGAARDQIFAYQERSLLIEEELPVNQKLRGSWKIGDLAWMKRVFPGGKLRAHFDIPVQIMDHTGNYRYTVVILGGPGQGNELQTHENRLKSKSEDDEERWHTIVSNHLNVELQCLPAKLEEIKRPTLYLFFVSTVYQNE